MDQNKAKVCQARLLETEASISHFLLGIILALSRSRAYFQVAADSPTCRASPWLDVC